MATRWAKRTRDWAKQVEGEPNRFERAGRTIVALAFAGALAAVLLAWTTGSPEFLTGWRIATIYLLVCGVAVAHHWLFVDDRPETRRYAMVLLAMVLLVEIVYRSASPGIGLGISRSLELAIVFALVLIAGVGSLDRRTFTTAQWFFVGCVTVITAILLYHTLALPPEAAASRWPLWAVIVGVCNLLVVPRFVPERAVLWAIATLSGGAALAGLLAVISGEYTVLGLSVERTRGAEAFGRELWGTRSVFTNPNTFGLLAFGGFAAAGIELYRSIEQGWRSNRALVTPGVWLPPVAAAGLVALTGIGLLLSYSRASWLAAVVFATIYLSYVVVGRSSVPFAVVAAVGGAVLATMAIYTGWLRADPARRFDLWRAGLEAIAAAPSALGAGHVSTSEFIEPYLDGSAATPHNGYLSITIRAGLLGGAAYAALVLGGILYRTLHYRTANVAMLALTAGWAVHHLFESYTVFHWTIPAVLSALSLGYLLFAPQTERRP